MCGVGLGETLGILNYSAAKERWVARLVLLLVTEVHASIELPYSCIFPFYLYYNYEKYPLSPLKPRSLALIEQYLSHIADPVYSVHQSFMWFLWLNWRKWTFYPVTAPNGSKCWPIVTSSMQGPVASNCDVIMTDCSRVVAMDAFVAQWWGQWSQHSGRPRTFLALISLLKLFFILFCDPGIASCDKKCLSDKAQIAT